jgi:hypothetical protein
VNDIVAPRTRAGRSHRNEGNRSEGRGTEAGQQRSFLLRLWPSSDRENSTWQASLEDPQTGERMGFASLKHLFAYLIELSERVRV